MWCKPTLVSVKISIVFFNDQQNRASPCLAIVVHLFMTHYSYIFAIVCLVAPVTYVTILELYVFHIKLGYQGVVDINLQNDSFWHSLQQLITAFLYIIVATKMPSITDWLSFTATQQITEMLFRKTFSVGMLPRWHSQRCMWLYVAPDAT